MITFDQWTENLESQYTCQCGDWMRDIYELPNGIKVYDEVCLPRSPFKPQRNQTLVDIMLPISKREELKNIGADLDEERYTPEGYGYPVFKGEDSLKQAFEFGYKKEGVNG